ncbi:MAG: penicillin-binding protein 1C [Pseudomonadota bacterium]
MTLAGTVRGVCATMGRRFERIGRRRRIALLALAALLLVPRLLPKAALRDALPSSRSVLAADGQLLRMTLASDQQYRLWVPLEEIAAPMQEAALLYEDKWFYWHAGLNPWALARASLATASGKRRIGGSTITMQLARRLYRIDSRSVGGKLCQAGAALWLELRYSKHDILEAYLNAAPYGGNVEGVGAASLTYWRKPVRALSVPEAINLAVIPQNPRKRQGDGEDADALRRARRRLAALWVARHPGDAQFANDATLALPFQKRRSLPFAAPHLVDYLLRANGERELHSSLDLRLQLLVERVLGEYVKSRADHGIHNAAALLVDTSTMQVRAMVGSSDYANAAIFGQVNGVFGKRSPGSTLKPFIYAQALDQGLIHSASILKDLPSNFGAFAPENFDGRFSGPIAANQALIRSRNIPAVDLASRLGKPSLYDFLKMAGVQKLAPEAHYGLALALGGAEVTMEELAQLYAILPNQGQWQPLRYLQDDAVRMEPRAKPVTLLSPEASFITLDMLRQTPRPDTFAPARPVVAWKTGTSWGFRDAWTAGVFGRHVLVVWVGNFDGASNPAFIGIDAAAPLFLRVVDAMRAEKLERAEVPSQRPPNLRRIEVCAASGDLPNAECPVKAPAWFIAGKSPIRQSTLHRAVLINTRTGLRACAAGPDTRVEVFEYWPSDMLAVFKKAGMALRAPPQGECASEQGGADGGPHIVSPLRGVTHLQRLGQHEPLLLRAEAGGAGTELHWFAGDSLLGSSKPGESLSWRPPRAGRYLLRVVDANGVADSRELIIETVE